MKLIQQEYTGDEIIFTIEQHPKYRYVAYPDVVNKDLDDYLYENIGVLAYRWPKLDYQIDEPIKNQFDISESLNRLIQRFSQHPQIVLESALSKALYLGNYDYQFATMRGYSQSEWSDVVLFMEKSGDSKEQLDAAKKIVDAWFKGDVYCVARQFYTTWRNDRGDEKMSWEYDDVVAGYLITSDYSIEDAIWDSGIITNNCDEDNRSAIACDCGNGEHKMVKCFDCESILERDCEGLER